MCNQHSAQSRKGQNLESHLPEFRADLVAALASLKVNNLSHGDKEGTATDKTRVVEIKISMVDLLLESLIYKLSYRDHGL